MFSFCSFTDAAAAALRRVVGPADTPETGPLLDETSSSLGVEGRAICGTAAVAIATEIRLITCVSFSKSMNRMPERSTWNH